MIQIIGASWHKVMIELSTPTHFPSFLYKSPPHTQLLHFIHIHPLNLSHKGYYIIWDDGWKGRLGFESKLELPSQRSNSSSSQSPLNFHLLLFSSKPQPSQTLLEPALHFFRSLSFHSSIPSFFLSFFPDLLQYPHTSLFLFYIFHNYYYFTILFTSFHAHSSLPNLPFMVLLNGVFCMQVKLDHSSAESMWTGYLPCLIAKRKPVSRLPTARFLVWAKSVARGKPMGKKNTTRREVVSEASATKKKVKLAERNLDSPKTNQLFLKRASKNTALLTR